MLTFVVDASVDKEETSDFALVCKAIKDAGSDKVTEAESLSDLEVDVLDLSAEIEKEETNVVETKNCEYFQSDKFLNWSRSSNKF